MISVVILTRNNEETIAHTLQSVAGFSEVILLDTGSIDNTLKIASTFPNVKVSSSKFTGFGSLRNKGAALAKNDWILALDSDEVVSNDLFAEIQNKVLDEKTVYEIPFHNFYKGKLVKCCGWYPESHIRLYNRKSTSFDTAYVHEGVKKDHLKVIPFNFPIYHFPYRSIDDFLRKMHQYSSLFAKQHKGKKNASFMTAFLHGAAAFFKSYLLKKGLLYGSVGFIISSYNASTAFYKYLKLQEENQKP